MKPHVPMKKTFSRFDWFSQILYEEGDSKTIAENNQVFFYLRPS